MTDQLFSDVCTMYEWTHSIKETAQKLEISSGKVRKILITEGYDMGARAAAVKALADLGMNAEEIAQSLHISQKSVNANMPYSKGVYLSENRSGNALRSERYRQKRSMLKYSDRVLNPNGDYGFVSPSARDIMLDSGIFQFNLSKLMELTKQKKPVKLDISLLIPYIEREEETFDEPPVVLEFNPTAVYAGDYVCPPKLKYPHFYKLLNCRNQIIDAAEQGCGTIDAYMFQMEEYVPYITEHFQEFARYWNSKLFAMIKNPELYQ